MAFLLPVVSAPAGERGFLAMSHGMRQYASHADGAFFLHDAPAMGDAMLAQGLRDLVAYLVQGGVAVSHFLVGHLAVPDDFGRVLLESVHGRNKGFLGLVRLPSELKIHELRQLVHVCPRAYGHLNQPHGRDRKRIFRVGIMPVLRNFDCFGCLTFPSPFWTSSNCLIAAGLPWPNLG